MKANNERVSYLFNRFYEKTITDDEKKELFLLLNKFNDEELSELMAQAFNKLNKDALVPDDVKANEELNKILKSKSSGGGVIYLWTKIAIAASFILFLSFGIYSYLNKDLKTVPQITKNKIPADVRPGTNKAILTLSNGATIVLDTAKDGVLANQGDIVVHKTKDNQIIYSAKPNNAGNPDTQINKISTPRGGQYQVVLPDGSKAWLNASSSISFPVAFNPNKREVDISGEVYFEVSKMHIPFIVKYDKGLVQVLGTHFNIMAYHNEAATEVTLLEGSVKVLSGNASNMLKPGQQAQLADAGEIKIADNVDINAITAWKNGVFLFKNTEIETVMRQISRWYDVDVKYEGKMPHVQITGKISRNVNASEILSMLSYTGIHFKIEDKNIIITQ
ncbi:MAG: FecR family protein [Mucilaginibacter sp.]|nr:FecR family protein [Mucilaginibacter sp.]